MQITTRHAADVAIIDIQGKLVIGAAIIDFRTACQQLLNNGAQKLLLNLTRLTALDDEGVGGLVGIDAMANSRGAKAKLCCVPDRITEIVMTAQLMAVFEIHETEAEALASFAV